MSMSIFTSHLVLLNQSFGQNKLDETSNPVRDLTLGIVKKHKANYQENGYQLLPDTLWIGSTYKGDDIVAMLYSRPVNTHYIVIITRNKAV